MSFHFKCYEMFYSKSAKWVQEHINDSQRAGKPNAGYVTCMLLRNILRKEKRIRINTRKFSISELLVSSRSANREN